MKKKLSPKKKVDLDKYAQYRDGSHNEKEKPENMLRTAGKLLSLLKGNVGLVVITAICACVGAVLTILGPQYLGDIVGVLDAQIEVKLQGSSMDFSPIYKILITILCIYIGSSLLTFIQHYVMAGIVQRLITQLRRKLNLKLSRLPLAYFDTHNKGDILSRITNDIDNINNTLQNSLIQVITSIVTFVGVFVIMFSESSALAVASLIPFPIGLAIAAVVLRFSKYYFRKQWKVTGNVNGHVEEMFTGHRIVKAYGREQKAIEEFDAINEELYQSARKAQFFSGLIGPLINFANNAGYVIICVLSGYLIINNKADIGSIVVFMTYTKLLMQPVTDLSNIANNLQSSLASAERVFNVLEAEDEAQEQSEGAVIDKARTITFDKVDFSYNPKKSLIKDFSLEVKEGDLVAIVGPTGAGKTTIVNLLMRFYEIQGGSIRLNGVDIRDMTRKELRSHLGMVLQDTWLFEGTLKENIMYSRPGATEEEFLQALEASQADSFVHTLPEGVDTMLEENGSNLSEGQRQLVTIARAILASPDILILDEATSSVDTRTELLIQRGMNNLMKGRTNFVIAHRLSTIREADMILVMNRGTIIETGTHKQLMAKGGFYAELYNSQFAQ